MYIESLIHITACIAFDNLVEQFLQGHSRSNTAIQFTCLDKGFDLNQKLTDALDGIWQGEGDGGIRRYRSL